MTTGALSLADIDRLTHGQRGVFDFACPLCGPGRVSPANRIRPVLRIWKESATSAGYYCARCCGRGRVAGTSVDHALQDRTLAPIAAVFSRPDRILRARHIWERGRPVTEPVETYLRKVRGFRGPIPTTIRALPAYGQRGPAMVAAFGLAVEVAPGIIDIGASAVRAVHLTRIKLDGSGKDGETPKIMVGHPAGLPIVLSPPNDLLGLCIVEGIETGLSLAEATLSGVWVAGSASQMPALAEAVPSWLDSVSIIADPDEAGQRGATALVAGLRRRGVHSEVRILDDGAAG